MAKQTTSATQSLTKNLPSRGKSDAASSTNRRRKRSAEKQPEGSNPALKRQADRRGSSSPTPRLATKQDQLAALLLRDEGATIAQMIEATGWLPHTVRAALSGVKKKGYSIDSDKVGDVRTYRATAPQ